MRRTGIILFIGILGALAGCAPRAHATPPAAIYYGESLLCRQKATGAVCMLWLDADGRYTVVYESPGPMRLEGRQGAYGATAVRGGIELCLRPDQDLALRTGAVAALFHEPGCLTLPTHPIGELYTLSFGGQDYTMGLAQGR